MYSLLLESLCPFTKFCFQNLKPNWYLSFTFVSHWLARTHSSGKGIVNSVTACTVLFQPSMLPVISKQQLDFVFQKYMQINFKYLWEIKIAFLQNLYLQSYLNIWNYLVYWERFGHLFNYTIVGFVLFETISGMLCMSCLQKLTASGTAPP